MALLATSTVTVSAYADDDPTAAAQQAAIQALQEQSAATADDPLAPGGSGPGGDDPLAPGGDRTVRLSLDLNDPMFDQNVVSQLVSEAQSVGLNAFLQNSIAKGPSHIPFEESSRNFDFAGDIQKDGNTVNITVTQGEVFENVVWWQTLIANVAAIAITILATGACAAAAPEAFPICTGISAAVTEFVKGVILQGFDGKLRDANEWGNTLVNTLAAGALAGGIATVAGQWATKTLASLFTRLGDSLRNFANGLSAFWGAAKSVLTGSADFLVELRPAIQTAMDNLSRTA